MNFKQLLFAPVFLAMLSVNVFGAENRLVRIQTVHTEMVVAVAEDEPAILKYWGVRLEDASALSLDRFREYLLLPPFGESGYIHPSLRVTHENGMLTTELVYVGSESRSPDANRTETVIHLKDKLYPLFVDIHFTAYMEEDVIARSVSVRCEGKKPIIVETLASAYLPFHADAYYLTYFYGSACAEMSMKEEKLAQGIKTIEAVQGVRTSRFHNPSFMLSLNKPADEDSGDIYGGSLAWSGNFKLSFEVDDTGALHTNCGMNDFAARYTLKPGQSLQTPEMILTYSPKGKGQVSRNFHDWSRKYALAHGDRPNPVVLNSWEGAYFNFSEETLTGMMDAAAEAGIEMFVLDDGWFGNKYPRDDDNAGLGDWQVNSKKLPRGMGYLADYAVSKGLRFGVWIEPEMVNPQSELASKHPEWIVKSGKREIPQMRSQWLLDLTNPAVQDFIVKTFDDVVALSPNITHIKWDANRHVESVGSEYLPDDRQTHFWYDYVQGLYSVYERIRKKHPDIEIQLCASGGGRLDFGALRYHDEFWTSDNTNALDRFFIQYGTSMIYPPQGMAAHVSTSPNHQTGMIIPLKFRFDVAMLGRLGLEELPEDELSFAKQAISDYKRIRPIVQFGDLYRMTSPYDETGKPSLIYVSKDKTEAVFFAYILKYNVRTSYFETKLKGLNPDRQYRITELNRQTGKTAFYADGKTFSGDYLMNVGISRSMFKPFESMVLLLEETTDISKQAN